MLKTVEKRLIVKADRMFDAVLSVASHVTLCVAPHIMGVDGAKGSTRASTSPPRGRWYKSATPGGDKSLSKEDPVREEPARTTENSQVSGVCGRRRRNGSRRRMRRSLVGGQMESREVQSVAGVLDGRKKFTKLPSTR